jgi:hypothetical protein
MHGCTEAVTQRLNKVQQTVSDRRLDTAAAAAAAALNSLRAAVLYVQFRQFTPETIQGCKAHCEGSGYSLAVVSMDWRCRCTFQLPEYYAQWPAYVSNRAECVPTPEKPKVETAAVYYLHANANTTGCRLFYPEFYPASSRKLWFIDYRAA